MTVSVLGVDTSLTCTGLAYRGPDIWLTHSITSKAGKYPDAYEYEQRMQGIADSVVNWAVNMNPDLDVIVIEGPSLHSVGGMAHERAGLWWFTFAGLHKMFPHTQIVIVRPTMRAKYATGDGGASKDQVMLAAARRYPDADITNNNEADAVILAAMGARYLEAPIESALPQKHTAAMKSLL